VAADFDEGEAIVADAWDQTLEYVEENWSTHLLSS
jgi:hypothetical protein